MEAGNEHIEIVTIGVRIGDIRACCPPRGFRYHAIEQILT
jgi:hypothetical protein